mmetsp:Transcript_62942/g.150367  ORF Transcript_62942/g.150367 Transcript_62942/m.150367 type:complete len:469 (-) Transcript_62942:896-2302(-)
MWIPRLRKDAEQLIIGKKVEPGEGRTLCLQIRLQLLLDMVQGVVGPLEALKNPGNVERIHAELVLLAHLAEQVLPELVNLLELCCFLWQLPLDVLCREDVLQIHPRSLDRVPLIDDIRRLVYSLLPDLHLLAYAMNEAAPHHRCDGHAVILAESDDILEVTQNPQVLLVPVVHDRQFQICPGSYHLLQRLFQSKLAAGICRNFGHILAVVEDPVALKLCQTDAARRCWTLVRQIDLLEDLLPMPRTESRVSKIQDAGHALTPFLDHPFDSDSHLIALQGLRQAICRLVRCHYLLVHSFDIHLDKLRHVPVVGHLLPLGGNLPKLELVIENFPRLCHLDELEVSIAFLLSLNLRGCTEQALVVSERMCSLFQHLDLGFQDLVQFFQYLMSDDDLLCINKTPSEELLRHTFHFLFHFQSPLVSLQRHLLFHLGNELAGFNHLLVGEIALLRLQTLIDNFVVAGHPYLVLP